MGPMNWTNEWDQQTKRVDHPANDMPCATSTYLTMLAVMRLNFALSAGSSVTASAQGSSSFNTHRSIHFVSHSSVRARPFVFVYVHSCSL